MKNKKKLKKKSKAKKKTNPVLWARLTGFFPFADFLFIYFFLTKKIVKSAVFWTKI